MSGPLSGRRIGLLTASASRLGGGVFEAVVQHAAMVRALGGEARVFALADRHSDEDRGRLGASATTYSEVLGPAQIGFSPGLANALATADLDCLHLHGIWMFPSRAGLAWVRRTGRPYFISPHGMLDAWILARGRWKKALARAGYERAGWRAATALHALTAREAADIRRESGRGDSLVIPNAGPQVTQVAREPGPPHVVYIGRIHAKKNLAALVEGWARATLPAGARLTIAGWGDPAAIAALETAVVAAGDGVDFIGPVFGASKQELLESARFVVLPSVSEGLPMAVLEAWAAGVPAIMTQACNLPEGFAAGAAIECGTDPAALAGALERALTRDAGAWRTMSQAARALAAGRFSAAAVAAQWGEAYRRAIEASFAGRAAA
ncbi:MAG: glycosyltransferase [Novosphingobium sp.]|nr:glycosyltransferase [Novosphingobium sp.]